MAACAWMRRRGAARRLHGRLEAGRKLDDLPLRIDADARVQKALAPCDTVEVRGTLDAAGNVRVERIRPR